MSALSIRPKRGITRIDLLILLMTLADAIEDDPTIRDRIDFPRFLAGLLEQSAKPDASARKHVGVHRGFVRQDVPHVDAVL